ncbi:hypothetical protein ACF0H5_008612 [Mactra antiquata]
MNSGSIIGLAPYQFVHILDLNTNITRVEKGPQSIVLASNERLVHGPVPMIVIPPAHYCVVKDPMCKYVAGKLCELKLGQSEVRFHSEPFCLYPGETLEGDIKPQPVINANHAIRLKAVFDHTDSEGVVRKAGDIWQIEGPLLFFPNTNSKILGIKAPEVIRVDQALKLRALQDFTDKSGRFVILYCFNLLEYCYETYDWKNKNITARDSFNYLLK